MARGSGPRQRCLSVCPGLAPLLLPNAWPFEAWAADWGSGRGALDGALLSGKTPACYSFPLAPDSLAPLERGPAAAPTAVGAGLRGHCALGAMCVTQLTREAPGP